MFTLVDKGTFRRDLYYRLNVIPVRIPSLAERPDDIPALVQEFVKRHAGGKKIELTGALMDRLKAGSWPGNVRELENLIERMVVLRSGSSLSERDLPADFDHGPAGPGGASSALTYSQAEQKLVRDALERAGWNRSEAPRLLDIPRHVLIYRMKKYDMRSPK